MIYLPGKAIVRIIKNLMYNYLQTSKLKTRRWDGVGDRRGVQERGKKTNKNRKIPHQQFISTNEIQS